MKKSAFSVDIDGAESKRKVMKSASRLPGIDSLSIDSDKKQLTVVGDIDPVKVSLKLRKKFNAKIETVAQNKKEGDAKPAKAEQGKASKEPDIEQIIRDRIHAYNYYHNYCGHFAYGWPCNCCPVEEDSRPSFCTIL